MNLGSFLAINAALVGVEKIQGSRFTELTVLSAGQLAGLEAIDGGGPAAPFEDIEHGDTLLIDGYNIDLTGKSITNISRIGFLSPEPIIVADSLDIAKLLDGRLIDNDRLILTQGVLSEADRLLIHRHGIDTIVTLEDDQTTTHHAPTTTGLDGDHITLSETPVYVDANRDMELFSEDGLFSLLLFSLNRLPNDDLPKGDVLGIDTTGSISFTDGTAVNSQVLVDGVSVGKIDSYDPAIIAIAFNENATTERVQELVRSLTLLNVAGGIDVPHSVEVVLFDAGGRIAKANVTIDPIVVPNAAPSSLALSAASVSELSADGTVVGTLSATDPNAGDTFTYELLDNAGGRFRIEGDKLVVAAGVKLDYEQSGSHQINVRVTDSGQLSIDRAFTVTLLDVTPENATGSSGNDILVGGQGQDTFSGGLGNDTLRGGSGADHVDGGEGNDELTGGAGKDILRGGGGRDVFVFLKSGLAARDTIMDFTHGVDKINLRDVDADTQTRADNRFTKILKSGAAFTEAGQLRYNSKTGILSGNTDKDAAAEFEILIKNKPAALSLSDFNL